MSERSRPATRPGPAESIAALVATLAALAATPPGDLLLLAIAAVAGAVSGRLGRSGPRVAVTVVSILVADDLGARIALALVPWLSELFFRERTLHRDALIVAISATFTLALVAAAAPPFAALFALAEVAAAIVSLAVLSLRAAAARDRRHGDAGQQRVPVARVALATIRFAASAAALAALVFVLLPRRPEGPIDSLDSLEETLGDSGAERSERRGRSRRSGSPLPGAAARLDPRRAIRLPDPATEAFTVRLALDGAPLSAAPDGILFRECALDLFDGDVWTHDESELSLAEDEDDGRNDGFISIASRDPGDGFLEQAYDVRGLSARYFACWPPLSLRAERALTDATKILVQAERTPVTGRYVAVSSSRPRPGTARIEAARDAGPAPSEMLATPRLDPRIESLAAVLRRQDEDLGSTAGAGTFVLRAEEHVRRAATYRLENRPRLPRSVDPIADLLFSGRASHCETFAAAMALVCRAGAVPARVAIGYRGAERARADGSFVVLERSRHAWVEAALDGLGWVAFDPTPSAPTTPESEATDAASAGAERSSLAERALAYWEDLDFDAQKAALASIASRLASNPLATGAAFLGLVALVLLRAVIAATLVRRQAWRAARVATRDEFDLVRAIARLRRLLAAGAETTPRELVDLSRALPPEPRRAAEAIVTAHEASRYAGISVERSAVETELAVLESALRPGR